MVHISLLKMTLSLRNHLCLVCNALSENILNNIPAFLTFPIFSTNSFRAHDYYATNNFKNKYMGYNTSFGMVWPIQNKQKINIEQYQLKFFLFVFYRDNGPGYNVEAILHLTS